MLFIYQKEGVQCRAYKDQTFGDIEDTLYKGESAEGGEDFDHFAYSSSSTQVDKTTKVSALTEKDVKPVYMFDAPLVADAVNAFVSQETKLKLTKSGDKSVGSIYYSINGGTSYTKLEKNQTITIPSKTQLLLKGFCGSSSGKTYGPGRSNGSTGGKAAYSSICFTGGSVRLAGNCMDLCRIGDTTSSTQLDYLPNEGCFYGLFKGSTGLKKVSETFLPCTKLTDCCYNEMFSGCTNLKSAPNLPTVNFKWTDSSNIDHYARGAYSSMFYNCSSLKTAPELPATKTYGYAVSTTGHDYSTCVGAYTQMFYGCTSLENVPAEIGVTSIEDGEDNTGDLEFYLMFYNCTSLKNAPKIKISDFSSIQHTEYTEDYAGTCESMFDGCTSLVSVDLTSMTKFGQYDLQYMFNNCISLKVNDKGTGTLFLTCPSGMKANVVTDMFEGTGGMTTDPVAGKSYYYTTE